MRAATWLEPGHNGFSSLQPASNSSDYHKVNGWRNAVLAVKHIPARSTWSKKLGWNKNEIPLLGRTSRELVPALPGSQAMLPRLLLSLKAGSWLQCRFGTFTASHTLA